MEFETLQASPQAAKEMADILAKTAGLPKSEPTTTIKEEVKPVIEAKKEEVAVVESEAGKEKTAEAVAEVVEKPATEKLWFKSDPTTTTEPKTEVEDKTDYKSEYTRLVSNPLLKALVEAEKAGKSPLEAFNELQPVNYKGMSMEQLAEAYGKTKGWSDEDISDEISKMDGKTRTEIENITNTWLNKLETDQAGKMEKFASDHSQTVEQQKQAEAHINKQFEIDLKATCEKMLVNEINGVKLTKDHVNDFIKTAVEFSPMRKDGTFNMEGAILPLWLGLNIEQFMGAAKAEGASEGRKEAMEVVSRPNLQSSQPQRLPEVKAPLTKEQQAQALIDARMGKK